MLPVGQPSVSRSNRLYASPAYIHAKQHLKGGLKNHSYAAAAHLPSGVLRYPTGAFSRLYSVGRGFSAANYALSLFQALDV